VPGFIGDSKNILRIWVYAGSPGGTPLTFAWVFDGTPGGRLWFSSEPTNVSRQWTEDLAASDDSSVLDKDGKESTDDAALAEQWIRNIEERNQPKPWQEDLAASDDGEKLDKDARVSTDDAGLSETWSRSTEPRVTPITSVDWQRTGLTNCPLGVETHCVGWKLSEFPASHHIRILRSTNGGGFFQVATGISLTNNSCSFSGGWDGTAQFTLPFGDNPGFNFTDSYRYRIQLRRNSDNEVIDEMDTANKGSSHHDCVE
jgi:hypothetical protein